MAEREVKSSKFINAVDEDLRNSIIRLDQKLKGLQAEINARIEIIRETDGNLKDEAILTQASGDVAEAIKSIKDLVNMVISDDITTQGFVQLNQENLDTLRASITTQLKAITDIKESF